MKQCKRVFAAVFLILVMAALCGCVMTVDQMYCLPRRSESFTNLQSVMESAMEDMVFCAPIAGDNQQPVQMADLDGDGVEEVIAFTKGAQEKPLHIMIFAKQEEQYDLYTAIDTTGTAFEQVEYVQLDGQAGKELVVGRQVQNQILRGLSVYRFQDGTSERLLNVNYQKFLTYVPEDEDGISGLILLNPGESEADRGRISAYSMEMGTMVQYREAEMSFPVEETRRIVSGRLSDGTEAVFVSGGAENAGLRTDVFTLDHGAVRQIRRQDGRAMDVAVSDGVAMFPDDIDQDRVLELTERVSLRSMDPEAPVYALRWYALDAEGRETTKCVTYHRCDQGWFMELEEASIERMTVAPEAEGGYGFYMWNEERAAFERLWTVYVLTGDDRSAQAVQGQRFVLTKTDTVVYAGELEDAARLLGVNEEQVQRAFHLIQYDWKTGDF